MNLKWGMCVVVAVLAALLVLPGVASAEEPNEISFITASSTTECDGTFGIELDFTGSRNGGDAYVEIEGGSYAEVDPPAGMTATGSDHPEFVDGVSPDEWDFEPGFQDNFFTLSGDYSSVDALSDGAVDVDYRVEWNGTNNDVMSSGDISVSSSEDDDGNPDNDWEKCIIQYCLAGDPGGGSDYSFLASPAGNCGFFNACINGEVERINEFDADEAGIEEGVCDFENPPGIKTIATEPEPEPSEEEEVAEVSPAIDEVAALPSTGYGESTGSLAWASVAAAFALIGVGGGVALVARRKS